MPMLRAVPSMVRMAESMESVFRSTSLVCAISRTWARVTLPILSLCGTADALAMPAARFSKIAAGGVLTTNVKDRSAKIVTTTGRMSPSWLLVWALKPLQNSMMLTPCWPRAGPTGGDGLAFPAVICSFTIAWTFFAMLEPLHLVVLELDGREAPEDRHHDLELAPLRVQVVDRALEVHERSLDHPHLVALLEGRLELRLLGAFLHLPQDPLHLFGRQRHRLGPRAHEPGDLRGRAHEVPRLVGQLHLHQEVPGEELLLGLDLLALADLPHLFRRHDHAPNHVLEPEDPGPRLDAGRDLVLEARVGVDHEPLLGRRPRLAHFRITPTRRDRATSTAPRYIARTNTTTSTTAVEAATSWRLGQFTRRNSPATSSKNSFTRFRNSMPSRFSQSGRRGGIRTPIPRIWSPVL